jgi:hypothetical protein
VNDSWQRNESLCHDDDLSDGMSVKRKVELKCRVQSSLVGKLHVFDRVVQTVAEVVIVGVGISLLYGSVEKYNLNFISKD